MQYRHIKSGLTVKIIGDHNEPYFIDKVKRGVHAYKVVEEVNNPNNRFLAIKEELKQI